MHRMLGSFMLLLLLAGAGLALARPSHAQDATAAEDPTAEVAIRDDRFTDARITVTVGTTVTWTHKGSNMHTVSALEGDWDSGLLSRGDRFSYTFSEPGIYSYLCRQHLLQGMRGAITVEYADAARAP